MSLVTTPVYTNIQFIEVAGLYAIRWANVKRVIDIERVKVIGGTEGNIINMGLVMPLALKWSVFEVRVPSLNEQLYDDPTEKAYQVTSGNSKSIPTPFG
jgi:hypothetical protein